MRLFPVALALIGFTGCWQAPSSDYARVLPDQRLEINLPVQDSTNLRSTEWSEYYLLTARVTRDVNGLIGGVLHLVDTVTDYPPRSSDGVTATWGPFSDALSPVETVLFVRLDVDTGGYTWGVRQRPKYDQREEAWVDVLTGEVDAGATHEASTGWFAIDFDAMTELDPNTRLTGTFSTDYAIAPEQVSATAGWQGFEGPGQEFDAWYAYAQTPGGDGAMDLEIDHDMNSNGVDEHHQIHSRWTSVGAGRSDALVTGPDLGTFTATATECWDETFAPVFQDDNWSGLGAEGSEAACAFEQDAGSE